MKTVSTFTALSLVLFGTSPTHAANTIDPNGVGATDVVQDPLGTPVTLTNPLPDPLSLADEELAIGNTASGELRIDNGSDVSGGFGIVGHHAGSTGVLTVDGPGATWDGGAGLFGYGLTVGDSGHGTLSILNGGLVSGGAGTIGSEPNSTGVVTVDGIGSRWAMDLGPLLGPLTVGGRGSGTLNITGGGTVVAPVSVSVASEAGSSGNIHFDNGTLTTNEIIFDVADLTGTGVLNTHGLVSDVDLVFDATHGTSHSFLLNNHPGQNVTVNINADGAGPLFIGYKGAGSMSISDGVVVSSSRGRLGDQVGSSGVVTIDGSGSKWYTGGLTVGYAGSGTLTVTGGADLYGGVSIGYEPGSTGSVTIDGAGSTWTNNGNFYVGNSGYGELRITHGANVTSGKLYVGNSGNGSLEITDGGDITSTWGYLGRYSSPLPNTVKVDGAGSTWTNTETIYVGYAGDATLEITDGGVVRDYRGRLGTYYSSRGTAVVDGVGSAWIHEEDFNVGVDGIGTLSITGGGIVTVGGSLSIGYGDSSVDISTGGMLAVFGEGDGSLTEFLGLVLGTDQIRYWDYDVAGWSDITGATYGDDYSLSYLTTGDLTGYTLLTVGVPMPGDFNMDGRCDGLDFLLWQRDPSVGSLSDWEADYGKTAGPVTITQSETSPTVPEPASVVLGALAGVGLLLARGHRLRSTCGR